MADDTFPPPPPGSKPVDFGDDDFPPPPPGSRPVESEEPSLYDKIGGALKAVREATTPPGATYMGDIGVGALRDVTGAAEIIPGVQPYAHQASESLEKSITYPSAETIGGILPFLAGGDVLIPAKLSSLVPAGMEGKGLIPAASRILSSAGRGALTGAVGTAEYNAAQPSGKEDYGENISSKIGSAETGLLEGGVGGAGVGGAVRAIPEVKSYIEDKLGGAAKKAAEEIRSSASEKAERAASQSGLAYGQESMKGAQHETILQGKQAELAHTQQQKAGAEQAAQKVAQEINANPKMDAVELGANLQTAIDNVHTAGVNTRKIESGFAQAVDNNKDTPLDTSNIRNYVDKEIKDVVSYGTRGIMSRVQGMTGGTPGPSEVTQTTLPDFLNFVKGEVEGTNRPPLTLKRAESLRGVLDTLIRTKFSAWQNLSDKQAGEAVAHAKEIRSMLIDDMRKAAPDWSRAFDNFKKFSRPLDPFERKGAMAGLDKEDPMSGEYEKLAGEVTAKVLNKTALGSDAIAKLVAKRPELRDQVKAYLMEELGGPKGLEREITPEKFRTFMEKNKQVLKQLDLTDEFNSMRQKVESSKAAIDQLTAEETLKKGEIKDVTKLMKDAYKSGKISQDLMDKYTRFSIDLEPETLSSKDVLAKANSLSESLFNDHLIGQDEYRELSIKIRQAKDKYESAEGFKRFVHHVIGGAIYAIGLGHGSEWLYRLLRARL